MYVRTYVVQNRTHARFASFDFFPPLLSCVDENNLVLFLQADDFGAQQFLGKKLTAFKKIEQLITI
jgi:hypothetical protein